MIEALNLNLKSVYSIVTVCPKFRTFMVHYNLSHIMRKPHFCICENKGPDQLCRNRTADQGLYFHYKDSTIPLSSKFRISSH